MEFLQLALSRERLFFSFKMLIIGASLAPPSLLVPSNEKAYRQTFHLSRVQEEALPCISLALHNTLELTHCTAYITDAQYMSLLLDGQVKGKENISSEVLGDAHRKAGKLNSEFSQ